MPELDLDAIRARVDGATPGMWYWWPLDPRPHFQVGPTESAPVAEVYGPTERGADAEFIAHARTDVPALLAEVERLREELDQTRAARDDALTVLAEMRPEQ